jgi:hypothetical protein
VDSDAVEADRLSRRGTSAGLNGDADYGAGDEDDGHLQPRSQLLFPDAQLEQELSSLIKR